MPGNDLVLEGIGIAREDLLGDRERAVVERRVAPDHEGAALAGRELARDRLGVEQRAGVPPGLHGGAVGGGRAVALGIAQLHRAVRRPLDVALADLTAQIDEIVLLLALLDDEEDIDLVERADRLRGHVLGVARPDPDQQQSPHGAPASQARAPATSRTVGGLGPGRPPDHDHREAPQSRRLELRGGQLAAAVLGHEQVEPVAVDQLELAREVVGPAVEQHLAGRRERRLGRVDAADQEPRLAQAGECREPLPAGRQEDPSPEPGDGCGRLGRVADPVPVVAGVLRPAGALEPEQGHARRRAGRRGRLRDALREGVRGVDDRGDVVLGEPRRQRAGAPEAAHAHLPGRQSRPLDAARERRDDARALGAERPGQIAGLGRAPEHEHRHGTAGRSRAAE